MFSITGFIVLLIIAGICGGIGQSISGYSHGGCLTSIALGFIGAILGGWLAHQLGLPNLFSITLAGVHFPILWSIAGSALFVAVLGFLTKRRGS